LNVAVAELLAFRSNLQVDVPLQAPDHPANLEPDLGSAVNVTDVLLEKSAVHASPQLMPEGSLLIVPTPLPALCTVS
jgi:hypothetical protein